MLKVINICKSYNGRQILQNVSFCVDKSKKIGLIGSNGSGKSTLMKIICGFETPDEGSIEFDRRTIIGYLKQEFSLHDEHDSVYEYIKKEIGLSDIEEKMSSLEDSLDDEANLQLFCNLQEEYIALNGYEFDHTLSIILKGLGLDDTILSKPISMLSGGQKNKILLCSVLLRGSDLLLLDEPTNNLDEKSIIWIENYVKQIEVPCIIISHDRKFLDSVTNHTIELNYFTHEIFEYPGSYSRYIEFKKKQEDDLLCAYEAQQEEIRKVEDSIRQKKRWADKGRKQGVKDNDKYTRGYERDRSSSLASNAKTLEKALEHMEKIDRPLVRKKLHISINVANLRGSKSIVLRDAVCGYLHKFRTNPITFTCEFGEKVVIVGNNGVGKSTLIKTLLGEIPLLSGTIDIGSAIKIGYISQETKENTDLSIDEYLGQLIDFGFSENKSELYTRLKQFNFQYEDKEKRYTSLSPGERIRVQLVAFTFLDINTIILDEPTNHLDIDAMEALEEVLSSFQGSIIAISHDRTFIEKITPDKIVEMTPFVGKEDYNE